MHLPSLDEKKGRRKVYLSFALHQEHVRRRCESCTLGPALTSSAYLSGQIDPDIYEPRSDINIIILIIAIMNLAGGKITLGWGGGRGNMEARSYHNHQTGLI